MDKLYVQCCVCGRVRDSIGRFRPRVIPEGAEISHGYCRRCALEWMRENNVSSKEFEAALVSEKKKRG